MISLSKADAPNILIENTAVWTQELKEAFANNSETEYMKSRYRNSDIKDALISETHGKCAYCESKLLHNSYGDIEHIVPKKKDADLYFDWSNLTLACDICNTNKSTHSEVIDPYTQDPHEHFTFLGPSIWGKNGNPSAIFTEKQLHLNRINLIERRTEGYLIFESYLIPQCYMRVQKRPQC